MTSTGYAPHAVIAQGFQSTAGDSAITGYSFDWGDGSSVSSTTKNISGTAVPVPISYHRYTTPGTYTLRMTVTDANGNQSSATESIVVNAVPSPDIIISGGDLIAQLNAAASGKVIQINAGTYVASGGWNPKNNQFIYANGSVIINGNNAVPVFAVFYNTAATGVILSGLRITGFTDFALYFSGGSIIMKDCEVDTNGSAGTISGGLNGYHASTIVLDNCHFHHNKTYNIAGGSGSTLRIIGGEYNHGFTDTSGAINPNAGDGVFKHVHSSGDYIVGANIHDNQGSGLWWDGNNGNVYVCLCTLTNNYGDALFCEINDAAFVGGNDNLQGNLDNSGFSHRWLFNTLSGNGYPAHTWFPTGNLYPATMYVAKSDKIEMAYNWIDGGSHALTLDYQVDRPQGHNLANISFHDNDVRLRETGPNDDTLIGRVGFLNSFTGSSYALTNVVINNNHYYIDHDDANWTHFMNYSGTSTVSKTFAQWQALGWDLNSTKSSYASWPH